MLFPLTENIPSWDQWHLIALWKKYFAGENFWPALFAPYNGHYNILPRFLFFGMGLFTSWNVRVEVGMSYVVCLLTLAVLLKMLKETDDRLLVLAAPVSAYVFYLNQFENFMSGYPLGQNLSQLAATLVIYCLARSGGRRESFRSGVASAVASTLSWGAGVAVWPAGFLALASGAGPRQRRGVLLAIWSAIGAIGIGCARIAASSSGLRVQWKTIIPFALALMGRPYVLDAMATTTQCLVGGLFVTAAFGIICFLIATRTELLDPLRPWVLLGLLTLGSGALISLARSAAPQQALASHYVTAMYPLGVAILVSSAFLALRALDRATTSTGRSRSLAVVALLVAAPLLQTSRVSAQWLPVLRGWAQVSAVNNRALLAGTATDAQIQQSLHPQPKLVREGVTILKRYRLAIFADR